MIMKKRINIAELLKDCPKGMELDCTMFENVTLVRVDMNKRQFPIEIAVSGVRSKYLSKEGCFHDTTLSPESKCVIFPKGKTTWDGFVPPCQFKNGDVLVSESGNIVLLSHIDSENIVHYHCIIPTYGSFRIEENTSIGVGRYYECVLANEQQKQRMYDKIKSSGYKYNQSTNKLEKLNEQKFNDGDVLAEDSCIFIIQKIGDNCTAAKTYCTLYDDGDFDDGSILYFDLDSTRLATEEEKQKLFDAIKANGYKWNAETKTLEKVVPKFRVGDRIQWYGNHVNHPIRVVKSLECDRYRLDNGCYVKFGNESAYKLLKFNINTLVPFESKVLVRHNRDNKWCGSFFSHIDEVFHSHCYKFVTISGRSYPMCIPYEGNEHLLSTTDDCDEYYKTWE